MSTLDANQDALVTFELVRWRAAHCQEHDSFDGTCVECAARPQCCPKHPPANGGFPGFDLGCQDCMRTRPGYDVFEQVGQTLMSVEEAVETFRIPAERARGGRQIRVPFRIGRRR